MFCEATTEAVAVKVAVWPSWIAFGSTESVTVGVGPGVGVGVNVGVGVGVAVGVAVGVGVGVGDGDSTLIVTDAVFELAAPLLSCTVKFAK